jgi:hypothetical protein
MPARQKLKQALSAPARRFFDRRFGSVDASVREVGTATRQALERDLHTAVDPLARRLDELSGELAALGRSQVEAMGYVATALRSVEDRLDALADALARSQTADADVVAHPYAVRALGALEPGERVLAVGFERSRAPLSMAAVGLRVTAVGPVAYAFEHANLEALIGEPEDVGERFAAVVWAARPHDPRPAASRLSRSAGLLDPGGLVVLGADPAEPAELEGFELVDRTVAGTNGSGTWTAGREEDASLVLFTARRA